MENIMERVYYGNWTCLTDMLRDFCIDESDVEGYQVLYAWYEYEDYSGSAFVLLEKAGVLYEINGGHCSCYGLEDQFFLEETNVEALLKRKHFGVNSDIVFKLNSMLKVMR